MVYRDLQRRVRETQYGGPRDRLIRCGKDGAARFEHDAVLAWWNGGHLVGDGLQGHGAEQEAEHHVDQILRVLPAHHWSV
jgi:hypothetical protein